MTTLGKLIRTAHAHPEAREHLLPIIKEAMEFNTEEARKKYLDAHPKADPARHTVKKPSGGGGKKDKFPPPKGHDQKSRDLWIDLVDAKADQGKEWGRKIWDWDEAGNTPTKKLPKSIQEAIKNGTMPTISVDKDQAAGNFNIPEKYRSGVVMVEQGGGIYLVNPEGYDYPRYVTKLTGLPKAEKRFS